MKVVAALLLLLGAQTLNAAPEIVLSSCVSYEGRKLPLKVVRIDMPDGQGGWDSRFFLEYTYEGKLVRDEFDHGGSGDEDYDEYKLKKGSRKNGVKGAAIHNAFRWVALVDTSGSVFARCQK